MVSSNGGMVGQIIQVTNITPSASIDQLRTLFGHVGKIDDLVLYPLEDKGDNISKVCYIRYEDPINAEVALHLNNTVFLDRALIVLPLAIGTDTIPDETYANLVRAPPNTAAGVLPRSADWPLDVISMVIGRPGDQAIHTVEPRLASLGLPPYPPLPATTDGNKIEEIRRTILVTNLDPTTTGEQVLDFFNQHAEVRCVRMAGGALDRAAYVEFTEQPTIASVFGLMGATLNNRQVMIQHSNCAIIKPSSHLSGSGGGLSSFEEAAKRIKAAESLIMGSVDQMMGGGDGHGSGGRIGSGRRSRSRSRSPGHRSHRGGPGSSSRRSRSRRKSRSRSRGAGGGRRSRSKSRHRKSRHSRSRSRPRRHRPNSRSRSREKRRLERSRSRGRRRSRHRSRSHSHHGSRAGLAARRHVSRSKSRGDPVVSSRPERRSDRDKERERDREGGTRRSHHRDRDRERDRDKERESRGRHRRSRSRDREAAETGAAAVANGSSPTVVKLQQDEYIKEEPAVLKSEPEPDSRYRPLVVGVKLEGPEDLEAAGLTCSRSRSTSSSSNSSTSKNSSEPGDGGDDVKMDTDNDD